MGSVAATRDTVNATTPVLVLGLHHGGLAIARTLGRWGVDVIGITDDPDAPGAKSRYLSRVETWDDLHSGSPQVAERLVEFLKSLDHRPLVIPTSDETTVMVADNAERLADLCLFARQDAALTRALADKRSNYELAVKCGVPVPECIFEVTAEQVDRYCRESSFPVVLKGIDGGRLYEASGFKMIICQTPDALSYWYEKLSGFGADNLMLQEYIPGKDDTIWIFNGYFDANSRCLGGFTGKKIRQTPVHVGSTSLGLAVENPEVEEQTVRFMQAIHYTGVLDIGFRYDARDGRYKLLDPNPRVGSTFRLFVDQAGMDVVRMLYLDQTGQRVPEITPRYGRKWMVEDKDIESTLVYIREGEITWFEWVGSLAGVEEGAWFALDDWAPFIKVFRRFSGRVISFPLRWFRRVTNGKARKSGA